ncbi:GSCOCG00012754001-RA-CDS, partial [Cotesia congregata]
AEKFLRDVVAENRWQNEDPNILSFLSYLHTTWLRYSKHVSVYECESLTTDGAESFHRHNKIKLGGRHPCIWTLSDGIEKILIDEEINYKRLLTTAKPPKRRTPQYVIDRLNYVNNLKRMISKENQKFDVATYLKMMPKSIEELLFTLKLIIGNDIDFITNDDSVPHELDIPFFPTQSSASKCQVSQSSKIPTKFSNPSLKNKEKAVKNSPLVSPKFTQVMTISGTKYKKPPSSTVTSHSLKIPQKPDNTTLKKIKLLTATPLVLPKSNEILMSSVTNNRKPPSSTVTSHSLTIPEKPDNPILKENKP